MNTSHTQERIQLYGRKLFLEGHNSQSHSDHCNAISKEMNENNWPVMLRWVVFVSERNRLEQVPAAVETQLKETLMSLLSQN